MAHKTGLVAAFTTFRMGRPCENRKALLAVILADAMTLGLARMADATEGLTRDQLLGTNGAYIRDKTCRAVLALVGAQHVLPIAGFWSEGTSSASDGQFSGSRKRGDVAGDVNARYRVDPGYGFYTHTSDQHAPFAGTVISAAEHEAPFRPPRAAAYLHWACGSLRFPSSFNGPD